MDDIKTTRGGNKEPTKPTRLKPCPLCGGELDWTGMFWDGVDKETGRRIGGYKRVPYCMECHREFDPQEVTEEIEEG